MEKLFPLDKALRIESERLYLRPLTLEDTDTVLAIRNSDYVRSHFFYRSIITKEEHENFFRTKCENGEVIYFLICEKETDRVLGGTYMQKYNSIEKSLESGIFLDEHAPQGKGYATEAFALSNSYVMKTYDLSKIYSRVCATNIGSIKVQKKVGFHEIGRCTETVVPTGEKVEAISFCLERDRICK